MKKILCPTDFSEYARNGINYANEIAKKNNAELILCHTYFYPPLTNEFGPYDNPELIRYSDADAREKLQEIAADLRKSDRNSGAAYKFIVRNGFLLDEITRVVEEENIDLVVMGTEGAEGLDEMLFGSLSGTVLSKVTCPVLVVPKEAAYHPLKEIIYATDLKNEDEESIRYVARLAELFEAHIAFLNIQKEEPEDVKKVISYALKNLLNRSSYDNMSFHMIEGEGKMEELIKFAGRRKADLVVMSTYKRNFLQKIAHRSLTKRMAYHSNIPVLALHKEKIEAEI